MVRLYREGKSDELRSVSVTENKAPVPAARVFRNVDGIKFLVHEGGCGGTREDAANLCGLLAGYIHHPNVAGARQAQTVAICRKKNVTGEQSAEICSVLSRTAATTFVHQEFYAVDIAENSRSRHWRFIFGDRDRAQLVALALSIQAHHFCDLAAIDLRCGKTQFFFKGLLQNGEVAVFAEDQRSTTQ